MYCNLTNKISRQVILLLFFFTIVGSFIISAFSYNIYIVYVTFGIMCGTAQSFLYVGGASILYHYFEDKKALATSELISSVSKKYREILCEGNIQYFLRVGGGGDEWSFIF